MRTSKVQERHVDSGAASPRQERAQRREGEGVQCVNIGVRRAEIWSALLARSTSEALLRV